MMTARPTCAGFSERGCTGSGSSFPAMAVRAACSSVWISLSIIGMSSRIPLRAELHVPPARRNLFLKPIPKRFGHPIRADLARMCNWQKGTSRKILPYPNFAGRKCLQYQNMTCVIILLGVKKKPNRRRDGLHEFGHVRADLNNQKANKMTGFWRKGFMAAAMVIGLLGAASALAQENPSTNAPAAPAVEAPSSPAPANPAPAAAPAASPSPELVQTQTAAPAAAPVESENGLILPHDLSPWGMFMAADWVVKAVMIG